MVEQQFAAIRSSGGFRSSTSTARSSSSSSRSSSSSSKPSSSSSKSSTSTSKPAPAKPKPVTEQKVSTKPGTSIKTASGTTVKSSTKTPTNKKYTNEKGIVGANGYTPRFQSGYSAPAGSVVYYPQHSALDYLPWIYLFSVMGDSPRNDQTTIVQPDGKEVQAKPVQEGVDGLAIMNWIILIIIVAAIVAGIVYLVNKLTTKKGSSAKYA